MRVVSIFSCINLTDVVRTASGNLLAGSSDTNNDGLSPSLMAGLECSAHDVNVTYAVRYVVAASISYLNKLLLNTLRAELSGVNKVSSTKLLRLLLLRVIYINNNNLTRLVFNSSLNDGQTNTASTKDGNIRSLLNTALSCGYNSGTVTSCNTAAKQTGAVYRGLLYNSNNRDVSDDSVLGECRCAYKVEKILALALKAQGAVRHNTLALRCANLTAQVSLARLTELALLAL